MSPGAIISGPRLSDADILDHLTEVYRALPDSGHDLSPEDLPGLLAHRLGLIERPEDFDGWLVLAGWEEVPGGWERLTPGARLSVSEYEEGYIHEDQPVTLYRWEVAVWDCRENDYSPLWKGWEPTANEAKHAAWAALHGGEE